jgi:beta-lactamase class A
MTQKVGFQRKLRCRIANMAILLALASAAAGIMSAQTSAPAWTGDSILAAQLQPILAAHHGKVAMYAVQLNTGKTIGLDQYRLVKTASDIKLAMLYEAMAEVREGKAKWDEKLTLKPGDPVPGSGILTFFDTPLTLTLKDALTFMVIVSDNTATNMMIDRFGVDAVNNRMKSLGLGNTYLYKKVMKSATGPMPADQPKFGLGKSTPYEMATLMTRIGRCQLHPDKPRAMPVPPVSSDGFAPPDEQDVAVCKVALNMLKNQFYRETIPRYLEKIDSSETGSAIANKTGSLNAERSDVAIVVGKTGPMVLAIFTYENADHGWTVDNEGEMTIAKLAEVIVKTWSSTGIDGKTLVPGLAIPEK